MEALQKALGAIPRDGHFYAAIGAAVLVAIILYPMIFNDYADLLESLRYMFQPGWLTTLRGEWTESFWSDIKVWAWLLASGLSGWGVYVYFPRWFPAWFS